MNTAIGHPKSYHTYKSDDELLLSRHNWGLYYPKWLAIRIIGGIRPENSYYSMA